MNILLTGVNGYIGKRVAQQLKDRHKLFIISRDENTPSDLGETVICDLASPQLPSFLPDSFDTVLHLAQSRKYRDVKTGADDMYAVNANSTRLLAQYAVNCGAKNFCYISTGSVYGSSKNPFKEDAFSFPNTMLGASKLAGEIFLQPYSSQINISVLRLFLPYGPHQIDRMINDLINRVKNKVPITIAGDGEGTFFSTTYIDDLVTIICDAVENEWSATVNVASPSIVSIRTIGETIGNLLNISPIFEQNTKADAGYFVADITRLAKKYNVNNMLSFEDGIKKIINSQSI